MDKNSTFVFEGQENFEKILQPLLEEPQDYQDIVLRARSLKKGEFVTVPPTTRPRNKNRYSLSWANVWAFETFSFL